MKYLILAVALTCGTFYSLSQDIIEKRDGSTMEVKVIEITETMIKYKRKDQPDGPLRNIAVSDVAVITYADGSKERFVVVKDEEARETPAREKPEPKYEKRRGPDRIPVDKDRLFEPGFFMDLLPGYAREDYSFGNGLGSLGIRVGNKWYFGKGQKYRPGIQATWLRVNPFFSGPYPDDISDGFISPLNLGFANIIKFGEKSGMEVNLNFGPILLDFPPEGPGDLDILYGMDVKYRYGRLAVGIDCTRIGAYYKNPVNTISLSAGLKF